MPDLNSWICVCGVSDGMVYVTFFVSLSFQSINHITLLTQKIREVAMSDSHDDDDRRYRPVTLSRKYLRSRDSAYALKTLESMSREDLVRAFVKIQTSFVGGRSRSGGLEALVTCGGT